MNPPEKPGIAPPQNRTWLERHVLAVVLLVVGMIGLMVVLCCGGAVALVFHLTRNSPAYTLAMQRLADDPAIMQRFGEPIEPGWLMSSSISLHNDDGQAKMRIPLKGKKESGEVFIEAEKHAGMWTVTYLAVQFEKDPPGQRVVAIQRDKP